jgi:GH24 family phage-related lysozyme (muramidase)
MNPTDDSFIKNPVVQSILARRYGKDKKNETKDFLVSLLINAGTSFLNNFAVALPQARQQQIDGIKENLKIGLGEDAQSWNDYATERKELKDFNKISVGLEKDKAFQAEGNYLKNKGLNYYRTQIFPNRPFAGELGENFQEAYSSIPDFAKAVDDFVVDYELRERAKFNEYRNNKFVSSPTFSDISTETRRRFAEELAEAEAMPRTVFGAMSNFLKDKFGNSNAAIIEADAALQDSPYLEEKKQNNEIHNNVINNERQKIKKLYKKDGNFISYRPPQKDFNRERVDVNISSKTADDVRQGFEKLGRNNLYKDMKFNFLPTSGITADTNGGLNIESERLVRENKKFFDESKLDKAILERFDKTTGEYMPVKGSIKSEIAQIVGRLKGAYSDEFEKVRGVVPTNEDLTFQVVNSLTETGHLTYNSNNGTYVLKSPRADLNLPQLSNSQFASLYEKGSESNVFNFLISQSARQEMDVAPSAEEFFNQYKEDTIAGIKQSLARESLTSNQTDNAFNVIQQLQDTSNQQQEALLFLINPPEEYEGEQVKLGNNIVVAGQLSKDNALKLIERQEEVFNDGNKIDVLRNVFDSKYPEDENISFSVPDVEVELEENLFNADMEALGLNNLVSRRRRVGSPEAILYSQKVGLKRAINNYESLLQKTENLMVLQRSGRNKSSSTANSMVLQRSEDRVVEKARNLFEFNESVSNDDILEFLLNPNDNQDFLVEPNQIEETVDIKKSQEDNQLSYFDKAFNFIAQNENAKLYNQYLAGENPTVTSSIPIKNDPDTIAFGRTSNVDKDTTSDLNTEVKLTKEAIKVADKEIRKSIGDKVFEDLNDNQKVSLLDLVYNVGITKFNKSKAKTALIEGDMDEFILQAFDSEIGFVRKDGEIVPGLQNRRARNRDLFLLN